MRLTEAQVNGLAALLVYRGCNPVRIPGLKTYKILAKQGLVQILAEDPDSEASGELKYGTCRLHTLDGTSPVAISLTEKGQGRAATQGITIVPGAFLSMRRVTHA